MLVKGRLDKGARGFIGRLSGTVSRGDDGRAGTDHIPQEDAGRISSPEQLTDYLRVTNPGIWVVLAAVILLLAGVLAWSMVGTLETEAEVKIVVSDHTAQVIPLDADDRARGCAKAQAADL